MTRIRLFLGSLRLRMTFLLIASISGSALLGGFVTWRALLIADPARERSLSAIWHHLPDYAILLLIFSGGVGLLAVRRVTRPLARLANAVTSFAESLDPQPLAKTGPTEFHAVVHAFNMMQTRVSEGLQERVHMLSAINHDLRTPMARLALRLDQIDDGELRARLRADVGLLEAMVARGMELARGGGVQEPSAIIDVAALLQTVADDAVATGGKVVCDPSCGGTIYTRPETLVRCLTNLVDNAVRYAGDVWLAEERGTDGIRILVLDRGPGIPENQLELAFRPFTRLGETGRQLDGSGLGLTIARQQAQSLGGDVKISNRPGGGLAALVTLPDDGRLTT